MDRSIITVTVAGMAWVLMVAIVAGANGWSLHRQHRAAGFPTVQGVVIESTVTRRTEGRLGEHQAPSYRPSITYRYEADGTEYTNDQLRVSRQISFASRGEAGRVALQYPEGGIVTVYYDPDNPAASLLEPGLGFNDLRDTLILVPFVAVGAMIWSIVFPLLRSGSIAGGVRTFRGPETISARMTILGPVVVAIQFASLVAIIAFFAVVPFTSPDVVAMVGTGAVTVVVLTAISSYRWRRRKLCDPRYWLTINTRERTIDLPAFGLRKNTERVSIDEIESVTAASTAESLKYTNAEWRKSNGTSSGDSVGTMVLLHRNRQEGESDGGSKVGAIPAAEFHIGPRRAQLFADWLCRQTGLPRGDRK